MGHASWRGERMRVTTTPCPLAYRTFSEFVVETVRQRLQEMENLHDIKSMEKDEHE